MNSIKKITIGLTCLFSSISAFSHQTFPEHKIANFHANLPAYEFISKFNEGVNVLLSEYRELVQSPLDARLLNIAEPQTYRFLQGNSNQDYSKYFIAIQYFPDYMINNKKTSFCFILYNDKKRDIISNYYQLFPNNDIALSYIISHEFGHCITNHQRNIKGFALTLNPKQNESLADIIAYSYFISKGYPNISKSILKFASIEKDSLIHNSYSDMQRFIKHIDDNNIVLENKNLIEIFDISYAFMNNTSFNHHILNVNTPLSNDISIVN